MKTIEYHKDILRSIGCWMAEITNQDDDIMLIIDGNERSGKSTLAYWIAKYASEYNGLEYSFDKNWVWDGWQLIDKIWNLPKHSPIIYDEAGLGQYKYRSGSKLNVAINYALMISALRNQVFIYCVPNIEDMHEFIKNRRARLWLGPGKNTLEPLLLGGFMSFVVRGLNQNIKASAGGLRIICLCISRPWTQPIKKYMMS